MPRLRALTLAPLIAALSLTACGEPDHVEVQGSTLELVLDDYRITPQNVRMEAGRLPLRIVVRNEGRLRHNLKVISTTETDSADTPIALGGTESALPGERKATTIEDLEPGTYRLVCTLGNHDNLGQYGQLIVEEPQR